jgi:tetratricopeptide (TPR) repeat protein
MRNNLMTRKFNLYLGAAWLALILALPSPAPAASASDYILLGNEAAVMNKYDQAIAYYNRAINSPGISPQNKAVAYHNRACAHYDLDQTDQALRDFTQAIVLDPKYDPPYYHRSFIYEQRGDYARALADMKMAVSLISSQDPSYQEYIDRLEWLNEQQQR